MQRIKPGKYTIKEVYTSEGYILDGKEREIEIQPGFKGIYIFSMYNKKIEKTSVTVDKVWINALEELPKIEIALLRDGLEIDTVVLDGSENWTFTWDDLDKTDKNGVPYVYTVDEVDVPKDYEKDITENTIINTYIPPNTPPSTPPSTPQVNLPKTGTVNLKNIYLPLMLLGALMLLFNRKD